jgi:dUTP pyrophosphatase
MEVRFKKLNDLAKIPTRGSKFSAGYDLYAATNKDIQIPPHSTVKIGTGLAMDLPNGYFGAIVARSGIATKRGLRPINCLGVCDFDYKGEYIVALHNDTTETKTVQAGERIAQLILLPYQDIDFKEVDELSDTDRGSDGFGSSGEK